MFKSVVKAAIVFVSKIESFACFDWFVASWTDCFALFDLGFEFVA
ncbi:MULTISPECIES: hypothetical protein [Winkia]|nr:MULTISPECIES: hypothetical protein [Winkia]MDK8596017.1 hypothetical protein [Winkia sp. UMB1096A]